MSETPTIDAGLLRYWRHPLARPAVAAIVVALVPFVIAFVVGDRQVGRLNHALTLAVAILGVNLVVGYSGVLAFGHSAFVGIGAFTTATLVADHGWPHLATVPVAALVAFAAGVAFAIPALRLPRAYLAAATAAFALALPSLLTLDVWGVATRTGGVRGRDVGELWAPGWVRTVLGLEDTPAQQGIYRYLLFAAFTALVLVGVRALLRGGWGATLESAQVGTIHGRPVSPGAARVQAFVFGISAALAGSAGAMWVMNVGEIVPADFGFSPLAVLLLVGLIVGGISTLKGAVLGGLAVVVVDAVAGRLGLGVLTEAVLGGILIAATFFAPGGLAGLWASLGGDDAVEEPATSAPDPSAEHRAEQADQPASESSP
ncbi:MAG: hypothetical protein AAGA59_12605 [Actinomycetota bacterium]